MVWKPKLLARYSKPTVYTDVEIRIYGAAIFVIALLIITTSFDLVRGIQHIQQTMANRVLLRGEITGVIAAEANNNPSGKGMDTRLKELIAQPFSTPMRKQLVSLRGMPRKQMISKLLTMSDQIGKEQYHDLQQIDKSAANLGIILLKYWAVALGLTIGIVLLINRGTNNLQGYIASVEMQETKYRGIFSNLPIGLITAQLNTDTLSLVVVESNSAAERMFGYPQSEMVGQQITNLMPDRFKERHQMGVLMVSRGEPSVYLGNPVHGMVGLRKDHTEFGMALTVFKWVSEGETYFTAVIHPDKV
jgi:PAS domain S-box-containing protein